VERERNEIYPPMTGGPRSEDVCPRSSGGSRDEVPGPGQYADPEWNDDVYYNWHRYYIPHTGRYNRADPIFSSGKLYPYVINNPILLYDVTGLYCDSPYGCWDQAPPPHEWKCKCEKRFHSDAFWSCMAINAPIYGVDSLVPCAGVTTLVTMVGTPLSGGVAGTLCIAGSQVVAYSNCEEFATYCDEEISEMPTFGIPPIPPPPPPYVLPNSNRDITPYRAPRVPAPRILAP